MLVEKNFVQHKCHHSQRLRPKGESSAQRQVAKLITTLRFQLDVALAIAPERSPHCSSVNLRLTFMPLNNRGHPLNVEGRLCIDNWDDNIIDLTHTANEPV